MTFNLRFRSRNRSLKRVYTKFWWRTLRDSTIFFPSVFISHRSRPVFVDPGRISGFGSAPGERWSHPGDQRTGRDVRDARNGRECDTGMFSTRNFFLKIIFSSGPHTDVVDKKIGRRFLDADDYFQSDGERCFFFAAWMRSNADGRRRLNSVVAGRGKKCRIARRASRSTAAQRPTKIAVADWNVVADYFAAWRTRGYGHRRRKFPYGDDFCVSALARFFPKQVYHYWGNPFGVLPLHFLWAELFSTFYNLFLGYLSEITS